jgi:hypothetical protein
MESFEERISVRIQSLEDAEKKRRKIEVPSLYLPWTQRVLNPFPLASSGLAWGDSCLPWAVRILAFYCSVYVNGVNNGTNYWTLNIVAYPSVTAVASLNTSALAPNTFSRLSSLTIVQPASTDTWLSLLATITLNPGVIYINPAIALLRTG